MRRRLPASIRLPPFWHRRPAATLALLLLLALVVYERGLGHSAQPDDYTRYHNHVFEVVRVVDGDTVDLDVPDGRFPHTRVRLWGVDTPEVAGSRDGAMHYGDEASAFAQRRLLGRNVRVVLSPERTRDKYKRLLAYLYIDPAGLMFNEMLLQNGYAYADGRFAHSYKRQFESLEIQARRARAGLWEGVTPGQMPVWRQRMEAARRED